WAPPPRARYPPRPPPARRGWARAPPSSSTSVRAQRPRLDCSASATMCPLPTKRDSPPRAGPPRTSSPRPRTGAEISDIPSVAVLSHSGAGKTSLVEALLYRAGAVPTLGSVEEGTTASDYTPEEKRRKISIYSTVHPLTWKGQRFNVIDTPGYADFVSEIRGAMAAADSAMIVVSAVSGVAVGTERVWNSSLERELSTMVVINKMDRE